MILNNPKYRLLIVGHGDHGKDKLAEMLEKLAGLTHKSSSIFAAEKAVWPKLRDYHPSRYVSGKLSPDKLVFYSNVMDAYNDRRRTDENRLFWEKAITEYNADPLRLSTELYDEGYDIYTGMRTEREFRAAQKHPKYKIHTIFVDACQRKAYRDPTLKIKPEWCDTLIRNNGTEADLERKLPVIWNMILRDFKKSEVL